MSRRCTEDISRDMYVACTLDPDEDKEAFCEIIASVVIDDGRRGITLPMSKAEARTLAEHILHCLEVSA